MQPGKSCEMQPGRSYEIMFEHTAEGASAARDLAKFLEGCDIGIRQMNTELNDAPDDTDGTVPEWERPLLLHDSRLYVWLELNTPEDVQAVQQFLNSTPCVKSVQKP